MFPACRQIGICVHSWFMLNPSSISKLPSSNIVFWLFLFHNTLLPLRPACKKVGLIFLNVDKGKKALLKEFDLQFTGLKLGEHDYHFEITDTFFQAFEIGEIEVGNFEVGVLLEKKENMLQLFIEAEGKVEMSCDRCGDPLSIPVKGNREQIIKFGDGDYEQTDEIDVIPETSYQVNVARYIYELIMLHLPARKVHGPDDCNQEVLDKMEDYLPAGEEEEKEVDPRWAALSGLKDQMKKK